MDEHLGLMTDLEFAEYCASIRSVCIDERFRYRSDENLRAEYHGLGLLYLEQFNNADRG